MPSLLLSPSSERRWSSFFILSLSSVASLMTAGLGGARLVAPGHLGSDPQPCAGTGSAASAGQAAAIASGNSGMSWS